MVRVIDSEGNLDRDSFLISKTAEWARLKRAADDFGKQASEIKDLLAQVIDAEGEVDDKGHFWLELPREVEGYVSLCRQRAVSQKLDAEVAENLLTEKNLKDRCFKMVPVLDEDEVMACLYEGLLTEEDVDAMFPKTVTYRFVPSKKK